MNVNINIFNEINKALFNHFGENALYYYKCDLKDLHDNQIVVDFYEKGKGYCTSSCKITVENYK
jgi:hypothetical protein